MKRNTPCGALHDFLDDRLGAALTGPLAVGAPHRADEQCFGQAAHRLDGPPTCSGLREQVPAGRLEFTASIRPPSYTRSGVPLRQSRSPTPRPRRRPPLTTAGRRRARAPRLDRGCGMPPTTTIPPPSCRCRRPNLVAAQRITGSGADPDHVTGVEVLKSSGSSVSSVMTGSPYWRGVAPAMTNNQRGVMTPTPKETWLGLTRCTCKCGPSTGWRGCRTSCRIRVTSERPRGAPPGNW